MPGWKIRNSFSGKGIDVKKIFYIIIISIGAIALLKNALTYFSARSQRDALKTEIEELKVKNVEAEKKISGIYNDKELVEKKAREELGLVKEGETVIKIKK